MRFIAFSDIHYADYSTGITVGDVAKVERAITDACVSLRVDFCVFCGDRYLAHEPQDYVRVVSDAEQKLRNDLGVVTFSLVGNHDLYAKAPVSGHSNRHLQTVWNASLPRIIVMDEARTYRHAGVPGVAIHAIPACFKWTDALLESFDFQDGEFNLLVFHDMLQDSVIDHRSSYRAPKGKRANLIDDSRFNFVLGGDVHIAQRLPFQYTKGGYVGAAIQQSRRDRGNMRGWLEAEVVDGSVSMELVEGPCPRFVDASWDVQEAGRLPEAADIEKLVQDGYEDSTAGNIVDVVLTGSREQLDAVPVDWHLQLRTALNARRVNVMRRMSKSTFVPQRAPSAVGVTPMEDVQAYFGSGRAPLDGYDPDRLLEKLVPVLEAAGDANAGH